MRDPSYDATPLGWARHNHQEHVVVYLLSLAPIFEAVRFGGVERAAELLAADPSLANARDGKGVPLVFFLHTVVERLDEMLALLHARGADLSARHPDGYTLLDAALKHGQDELADTLRNHGARTSAELGAP